ncbi:hypothetical protein GA0070610_1836 [Micromonospora echinofusca]|uniref:Uncharacterized protein n=1 Tax=Micromonospora echinofusca TaxID=47858 RepID=A0A1C5G770_MICEH|nr:hypothetical protein GA0070610_1836 [Micromonospora echinofusca]
MRGGDSSSASAACWWVVRGWESAGVPEPSPPVEPAQQHCLWAADAAGHPADDGLGDDPGAELRPAAPAGLVPAVPAFADDALDACRDGPVQQPVRHLPHVGRLRRHGELCRRVDEQSFQPGSTLGQRQIEDPLPAGVGEQVEQHVVGGALARQAQQVRAGGDPALELREVGPAALPDDQFTVEHYPWRDCRPDCPGDVWEVCGQIPAGPRLQVHPVGLAEGDTPPPVSLRLMDQARALGHHVDGRCEHRRDRPPQHGIRPGARPQAGWSHRQPPPHRPCTALIFRPSPHVIVRDTWVASGGDPRHRMRQRRAAAWPSPNERRGRRRP